MNRTYDRHQIRQIISLNGLWDIVYDPDDKGLDEGWQGRYPERDETIWTPSCWNFKFERYNYDNIAWYRRSFHVGSEQDYYLIFEAASGQKDVWLDGKKLGGHYGSFTEFAFLTGRLAAGKHELVVRVDNRHDDYTLPRVLADWKHWGGLYRSVQLVPVHDVLIARVFIDPVWDGYEVKSLRVRVRLVGGGDAPAAVPAVVALNGREVWRGEVAAPADGGDILLAEVDPGPVDLWSPENPQLYDVQVVCGRDDLIERTGFRKIETGDKRILINGTPLKIKGVNRHHSHTAHGFAISPELTERDMDIIQYAGIDGIRGAHYPNEPLAMDFMDQRGIVFTEEMPFWGHEAHSLGNALFQQRSLQVLQETIERDYNHPAVIMWSLQNESASDSPEGRDLFGQMARRARQLDRSRLLTFSTDRPFKDICYDVIDVIGVNRYMGWYVGVVEDWPAAIAELKAHLDKIGQGDKPLLITEFGADAFIGERGFENGRKYSEEFQSEYLDFVLRYLLSDDDIAGMYIWQYCDHRTALRVEGPGRPRCYNTKGIVDEHRRPKQAFAAVRRLYRNFEQENRRHDQPRPHGVEAGFAPVL